MTTTAQELLADPWLGIDPPNGVIAISSGGDSDELAHFRIGDDDIRNLIIKVYGNGSNAATTVKQNLRQFVTDAEFEDSIDKSNTFTLTVHDPDWELLNLGATASPMDINPGGISRLWYRLDSYDVNDDEITLVFSTRNAVLLSGHKRPFKISRNKATRAQFIKMMLSKVKIIKIKLYCPELNKKQKIAKFSSDAERKKAHDRTSGFTSSDKITVKGRTADAHQKHVISQVVEAGVDAGMPGLVIVSAVMCIAQESEAGSRTTGNPPYVGSFQQNKKDGWPATGDAYKDAKGDGTLGAKSGGYYGMALKRYQEHGDEETLGQLVANVQGVVGSTNPLNAGYAGETDRWRGEAEHAVNAYGGIDVNDPGSSTVSSTNYRQKYEFMVGEPDGPKSENYLAAAYRNAQQVNWSFYWVRDVAHYISQEDLFKAKARLRLRRFSNGVEGVSFGWDHMKKVNTMTLRVRMDRWVCPMGTVVIFDEGGPDVKGRWLVTNVRRSMFDTLGTITLAKPINEKLEPAPGTATRSNTSTSTSSVDIGDISGTPKEIIDTVVIPLALSINPNFLAGGGNGKLSPETVEKANSTHGHTVSGNRSDHEGPAWYAWAADISTDWVDHPNGEKFMNELARKLGETFEITNTRGGCFSSTSADLRYRFQICYLTMTGGDHFNHVHFGVKDMRANPDKPPGGRP